MRGCLLPGVGKIVRGFGGKRAAVAAGALFGAGFAGKAAMDATNAVATGWDSALYGEPGLAGEVARGSLSRAVNPARMEDSYGEATYYNGRQMGSGRQRGVDGSIVFGAYKLR